MFLTHRDELFIELRDTSFKFLDNITFVPFLYITSILTS